MSIDQQFIAAYFGFWFLRAAIVFFNLQKYTYPVFKKSGLRPRGSKKSGFIFIRPTLTAQERKETLNHEYQHVKQSWYLPPFLFNFVYIIPYFQKKFEAQAYAVSHKSGRSLEDCVRSLAHNHYKGGLTPENIYAARKAINKNL